MIIAMSMAFGPIRVSLVTVGASLHLVCCSTLSILGNIVIPANGFVVFARL